MDFLEQERDLLGAVVCFLRADLGESCAVVKSQRARIGRSQVYFASQALSPAESNSGEVLVERFGDPLASCTRRNGDAIHIGEILVLIAKPLKVRAVIIGVGSKTDQEGQDLPFFVADNPEIRGFGEKVLHAGHVEAIDVGHHRLVESQHLNKVRGSCIANRIGQALRPMEKLGIVSTVKSKRDARLAIAALSPSGRELVNDASAVVDDSMKALLSHSSRVNENLDQMVGLLEDI